VESLIVPAKKGFTKLDKLSMSKGLISYTSKVLGHKPVCHLIYSYNNYRIKFQVESAMIDREAIFRELLTDAIAYECNKTYIDFCKVMGFKEIRSVTALRAWKHCKQAYDMLQRLLKNDFHDFTQSI
jgi:hypothetical protein